MLVRSQLAERRDLTDLRAGRIKLERSVQGLEIA
jgi:hypothetical protein